MALTLTKEVSRQVCDCVYGEIQSTLQTAVPPCIPRLFLFFIPYFPPLFAFFPSLIYCRLMWNNYPPLLLHLRLSLHGTPPHRYSSCCMRNPLSQSLASVSFSWSRFSVSFLALHTTPPHTISISCKIQSAQCIVSYTSHRSTLYFHMLVSRSILAPSPKESATPPAGKMRRRPSVFCC